MISSISLIYIIISFLFLLSLPPLLSTSMAYPYSPLLLQNNKRTIAFWKTFSSFMPFPLASAIIPLLFPCLLILMPIVLHAFYFMILLPFILSLFLWTRMTLLPLFIYSNTMLTNHLHPPRLRSLILTPSTFLHWIPLLHFIPILIIHSLLP